MVRKMLTDREVDVIRAYLARWSYKEAGLLLGITTATVKNHLYAARMKTGHDSTIEMVLAFRDVFENDLPRSESRSLTFSCPSCGQVMGISPLQRSSNSIS